MSESTKQPTPSPSLDEVAEKICKFTNSPFTFPWEQKNTIKQAILEYSASAVEENERLKNENRSLCSNTIIQDYLNGISERDQLRAQLAEAQKDNKRLLKSAQFFQRLACNTKEVYGRVDMETHTAAIDAAMKGESK